MAIVKDKVRDTYYINYKYKTPNGKWQNVNIRNKEWKLSVGLRYMKSIEQEEISKDKSKKNYSWHEGDDITLGQLVDGFFRVCQSEGIDYETIYGYKLTFKNYLYKSINPTLSVEDAFKLSNVDNFRCFLTSQGLKNKTVNNKLVAVKNLLRYAKKRKFISRDMADDAIDVLEPMKEGNRLSEKDNFFVNGEDDVRKFISSFDNEDKEWRIPVLTMFYGALRIGEWQAIDKKSVNFDNDFILINKQIDNHGKVKLHTKTGADRIVRLPHLFMLQLKEYIDQRYINDDECIFMGANGAHISRHKIRDIVNKHLSISGISHITLHGLRHSFATRMFDKGYDVKEVQEHLGHASMDTTMRYYIHYTQNKKNKDLEDLL